MEIYVGIAFEKITPAHITAIRKNSYRITQEFVDNLHLS